MAEKKYVYRSVLRSGEMHRQYDNYCQTFGTPGKFSLSEHRVVREFEHWVIVEDKFPYDAITEVHHLLVPRRVVAEVKDLNDAERKEFLDIVENRIADDYQCFLHKLRAASKSIPGHLHFHLLVIKKMRVCVDPEE